MSVLHVQPMRSYWAWSVSNIAESSLSLLWLQLWVLFIQYRWLHARGVNSWPHSRWSRSVFLDIPSARGFIWKFLSILESAFFIYGINHCSISLVFISQPQQDNCNRTVYFAVKTKTQSKDAISRVTSVTTGISKNDTIHLCNWAKTETMLSSLAITWEHPTTVQVESATQLPDACSHWYVVQ